MQIMYLDMTLDAHSYKNSASKLHCPRAKTVDFTGYPGWG
ncbi:hypothetical protein R77560_02069 [Ralstonia thomasii]|uniref:Uncharacterized protein n=1 Tax=Ralstonia thomasii TaxID=3058596 RepID=A0AAD2F3R3_9RALS|nr:hypothetical protein R77560_02069 [Ralstonia sp. LMG 18095]CAJ0898897.1 hypothetical protein R6138_04275 [Ralstonia sp. LMG 18095]